MNEVDIASLLSTLSDKELALAFRLIPKDKAAEVFSNMDTSMQTYLVTMFTEKELKELLDDLYMDDTVDMLEELPANLVKRILATVSASDRSMINQLLNYPEDSAGSIMTTEYVDLREEMTVGQAMAHIKKTGIHKETIYTCYITERRKLVGIVSAKDLMTTDDDVPIKDLMETEIISVYTHSDQEQVAQLFTKYDLLALPVIDQDGRMVGIVTFDDAMDVMVDEATEDITKMAAINPSEKTYFETSVLQHAKNRIPWLLILMFTSIITGTIITRYENAFAAIPLLVSFIPMLMDTGGNCGSQSATLIIRGIALDEIRFTDLFKVMFKEFRISLIVGAFLAVANGVRIFIQYHNPGLAVVIACSLMGTVIMAKLVGCTLPLLAKKVNLDPAIMASPLITTLVDTFSILIYFNIATVLFRL
jgi:magnesium transporter